MAALAGVDLSGIQIDRHLATTIYRQLCDQLREMIQRDALSAGTRMPSTRAFAAEVGVSRITAREVYDQLVAEGYLRTVAGSGTFVSEHIYNPATLAQGVERHGSLAGNSTGKSLRPPGTRGRARLGGLRR